MSTEIITAPASRSWKDISQPVKTRAMSREGRWRLVRAGLRAVGYALVAGALVWGGWEVMGVMREKPSAMPAAAKAVPVGEVKLVTDGVLDTAWLKRALALPKNAALMELDLLQLRARVLASGQVRTATLTRSFPATLTVQVAERSPVARLRAQSAEGATTVLLVASDGIAFTGAGFDPAMVETLPYLELAVNLKRAGDSFAPIKGMAVIAKLLSEAKFEADNLYQNWLVVSLARLESDGEIDVRTKSGPLVVFSAKDDFFRQLAKLDYQWDRLAALPMPPKKIDLTLGRDVIVTAEQPLVPVGAAAKAPMGTPVSFSASPNFQLKKKT